MKEQTIILKVPAGSGSAARALREGLTPAEARERIEEEKDRVLARLSAYREIPKDRRLPVTNLSAEKEDPDGWTIEVRTFVFPSAEDLLSAQETAHKAVSCIRDTALSLEAYERSGLVHGQIRPDNIFLTPEGTWVPGLPAGPEPEEEDPRHLVFASGDARPDRRSDVLSLGLCLHWLLNRGQLPFVRKERDSLETMHYRLSRDRRLEGELLPPPMLADEALTALIRRAAAKDPGDRFLSAGDLARSLDLWLFEHPEPVERPLEEGIVTEGGREYRILEEGEKKRILPVGILFVLTGILVFFYNVIFGLLLLGLGIRRIVIGLRGRVRWYGETGLVGRLIYRLGGIDPDQRKD